MDFKTLLQGAQIVAEEYDVSIASVYESDELFEQAHREVYKIDEFALKFVTLLAGTTVQSMTRLTLDSISKATIPQGVDPDDYLMQVSMGSDFEKTIIDTVIKNRAGIKAMACAYLVRIWVVRIWGHDEMIALPDDIKRKLAIS